MRTFAVAAAPYIHTDALIATRCGKSGWNEVPDMLSQLATMVEAAYLTKARVDDSVCQECGGIPQADWLPFWVYDEFDECLCNQFRCETGPIEMRE